MKRLWYFEERSKHRHCLICKMIRKFGKEIRCVKCERLIAERQDDGSWYCKRCREATRGHSKYAHLNNYSGSRKAAVLRNLTADFLVAGKMLDLGCGAGVYPFPMPKNLIQIDIEDDREARERPFHCLDLNTAVLPFRDKSQDAVILLHTIEHLENPWHCMREVRRILKSRGLLIVGWPTSWNIQSKLYYLFTNGLHGYEYDNDHLFFQPRGVQEKLFVGFSIIDRGYSRENFPFLGRWKLPAWSIFARNTLFVMRKEASRGGGR